MARHNTNLKKMAHHPAPVLTIFSIIYYLNKYIYMMLLSWFSGILLL